MSTYFGGSKARDGQIRQLQATTFAELVTSCFNVPCLIPFTREAFFALPKKGPGGRDEVKDGPYLCSVTFKPGETHRCDANAAAIVLVCVDLDDSDIARPFVESPESLMDATWAPGKSLNFAAWATANSTPENPRLRIVFEVEIQPFTAVLEGQKILARFVRFIATGMLGLPKVWSGFRETRVLSQPAYRPTVFSDDPKDYSPVIASRVNGRAIQLLDVPEDIGEEVRGEFAYHSEGDTDSDISNLPVAGLTVEDMREPLFKIDPDVEYAVWLSILASFRFQFRTEDTAEEAFHLADEWCRSGTKYRDGDTEAKWKSLRPDCMGKDPVTIRTFFRRAQDAGWVNTKLVAKVQTGFHEWLDACEDPHEIMAEMGGRIASVPFSNPMIEAALVSKVQAKLSALKTKVDRTSVAASISRSRRLQKRKEVEDDGNLPGWLRAWCYVKTVDRFHNIITGIQLSPEAFNRTYMIELMPGEKDEDAARAGRPTVMPCDYALNLKGKIVRKVDGVVYDPRWQGAEPYFEKEGKTYVNSYLTSTLPAPDEKNSANAGKMVERHLKNIIRELAYVEVLLDWMAFIVQNPGKKCRWVPVIQGAQGCGKSIILQILGAAIGQVNVKLSNPGATSSDFNDWAAGAQVVGIEEIRVKGKNRDEIMNKLKDVTTNDRVAVNEKHKSVVTVDNITNFIAFTNYHDALFLDEDDRRYFVVKSRIQSKQQKEELASRVVGGLPYFEYLGRLISMGGAVRHFLLNRTISPGFNPNGDAPDTCYRRQMIEESKNPLQTAIEDMISGGDHPMIGQDLILYEDLLNRTLALSRQNHSPSHFLYTLGYQPHNGAARYQVNGSRSQVWTHAERFVPELMGDPVAELKRRYNNISDESI